VGTYKATRGPYISLIIELKGVPTREVRKVVLSISVANCFFANFFDFSQLSYTPSTFAWANKPYAMDKRFKSCQIIKEKMHGNFL